MKREAGEREREREKERGREREREREREADEAWRYMPKTITCCTPRGSRKPEKRL